MATPPSLRLAFILYHILYTQIRTNLTEGREFCEFSENSMCSCPESLKNCIEPIHGVLVFLSYSPEDPKAANIEPSSKYIPCSDSSTQGNLSGVAFHVFSNGTGRSPRLCVSPAIIVFPIAVVAREQC